jgi:hypothetical protein
MPRRPHPLLSIRLIGPADVVAEQKAHLLTHLADVFGDRAVCRTSTRPADHATETRVYLTVTVKEVPPR